jgi:hypothetical protein
VNLTSGRTEGEPVAAPSLSSWHPGSHKFGMLAGVLLLVFGIYSVAYWVATLTSGAPYLFGDAFGLWSWARFLDTHPASEIYDPVALHTAQVALGFDRDFAFAYPPTVLLERFIFGRRSVGNGAPRSCSPRSSRRQRR